MSLVSSSCTSPAPSSGPQPVRKDGRAFRTPYGPSSAARREKATATGVLALIACALASPCLAQSPAEFYAGKHVDFIIGSAPGGGYHVYGTLLARHIGKHIPGKPQVIARQMEGAGSLTAANQLYSRLPADGTVLGAVFTGAMVEPLIGDVSKARYDSRRFGHVGSANRETAICFARKEIGFSDWRDALEKKLIIGGAGWTSSIRQYPGVLNAVIGTKFEIISGYPGSREAVQAVEKGEVQGVCGIQMSSFSPTNGHWIESGYVKVFGQIAGPAGDPALNRLGVQNIWDAVKSPEDKGVLELIFRQSEFGRPYIMPPGVPADRLEALRGAFDATMKDPEFLAEAARAKLPIDPMTGAEMARVVDELYAVPEPLVARARKALE